MQRIFIEKDWIEGDRILLPNRERHYLAAVLRLGAGGTFRAILDGEAEMEAVLEEASPRTVARIVAHKPVPEEKGPCITLLQAQLKAPRMACLVQKATELGANHLLITTTERTIPRPRKTRDTLERWKTIAREAAEQCGATRLPTLEGPLPFSQALAACEGEGLRLLLWEGEAPHLRETLRQMSMGKPLCGLPLARRGDACVARMKGQAEHIFLAIGPEGGFAPAEVEMAQAAGFTPVSLGSRILRSETAALAALAILRFALANG